MQIGTAPRSYNDMNPLLRAAIGPKGNPSISTQRVLGAIAIIISLLLSETALPIA